MLPAEPAPTRLDAEQYYALVERGEIRPDDRVELLEGVVVSMSPQGSPDANAIARVTALLVPLVGSRGVVRVQCSFRAGRYNVPEPDFAVVPGPLERWEHEHPNEALLIIEVSDTSLPTDRLSKAAIYAAVGVPQYLVVNLRGDRVETFTAPSPRGRDGPTCARRFAASASSWRRFRASRSPSTTCCRGSSAPGATACRPAASPSPRS